MHTMGFAKRRLVYVVAQRALENFPGEADPAVARCIFCARVLLFAQDCLPEFVLNLVAKQVAVSISGEAEAVGSGSLLAAWVRQCRGDLVVVSLCAGDLPSGALFLVTSPGALTVVVSSWWSSWCSVTVWGSARA